MDEIAAPVPPSRTRVLSVHFAPGARTAWHRHPFGQVLHVTEGAGLVQSRGGGPEFPDPAHPAHRAAVTVKAWVRDRLGQLTADLASGGRGADPELLEDQLSLIMEGAYALAQALSPNGPAQHARTVAESLRDVS